MASEEQFDICIVGSGPSGGFAAYELGQTRAIKVAVIEEGSDKIDMNSDYFVDQSDQKINGKVDFGFSRQVGGASNLWAGGLAKYDQIDFLRRDNFGLPGWPITFDELDRYYRRVDAYLDITDEENSRRVPSEAGINSDLGEGIVNREMKVLHSPFNTKKLVLDEPGIVLLKNCTATRLVFKQGNPHEIEYLEIFDQGKKKVRKIRSQLFVLGAGTVSNVRLLLHSFSQHYGSKKIECQDSIGRYISTHPKAYLGTLTLFSELRDDHDLLARFRERSHTLRYQFGLSLDLLLSNNVLNHCVRFDSTLVSRAMGAFEKCKSFINAIPVLGRYDDFISKKVVEAGVRAFRLLETIRHFGTVNESLAVRGFFDQIPSRYNRITLSDFALEDGLPLGKIQWRFSKEDWENVDRFMQIFCDQLLVSGVGKLNFKKPNREELTSIHSHFIGGARMGNDPANSVVDKNLKVHGVKNLYVSGPAVFPTYGYANPFYTIAALSIRLADHLKIKIQGK